MNFEQTFKGLYEKVVAVPTTIWRAPGELDLDANVDNAAYLFKHGIGAAIYAGGVGEHDLLSIEQQRDLLAAVGQVAAGAARPVCMGTGLGRTVERVQALAPHLAANSVQWAMLMPPAIDDEEGQYDYYSRVMAVLQDHGVWPVLYPRPERPMSVGLMERLFAAGRIPAVKLANNGMLLAYAEMVGRLGHDQCAWLCGTAGWWLPAYAAVGAARGMSSGIVNAFPGPPQALLAAVLAGRFKPDADYWTLVRIEQIRQRDKAYLALVIKYLQELVGLQGGMNGDGAQLPDAVKEEVTGLIRQAAWL
ncbi:MAG: hypothetical protein GKR89_28930 [Candidatus Latescibacteria bacterium]|nr:hypothetical protein [Candidatus Latescibacterota bacterium]